MKAVEATIRSWSKRANGEVSISLVVHRDDAEYVKWINPAMRVAVGIAEIGDDETVHQPATEGKAAEIAPMVLDKPLETERPAGVHNPYSRRAGILSGDKLFHRYIDALGDDHATFAASYIRNFCKVTTRKDILPGSEAATRFDLLESAFIGWRDGPKHGAAA